MGLLYFLMVVAAVLVVVRGVMKDERHTKAIDEYARWSDAQHRFINEVFHNGYSAGQAAFAGGEPVTDAKLRDLREQRLEYDERQAVYLQLVHSHLVAAFDRGVHLGATVEPRPGETPYYRHSADRIEWRVNDDREAPE